MIIGNIKSHTDLAKKKSIAKDLLEIEIANEAENQKRIRNYKSTYQAKAVPPVYKTPSELRQDKDKLLRDSKEKLQSLGLDYNIIQAVVNNYLNGSVDLLVKFNALFPSIRHNFQKNINPAFASVENITDLIREVMENTRNAFGFNAPTSASFQNLENARQSYNIKKDLVDLRGSDSMIELIQDDSLSEQAKSFVERINLLIRFLPSDSDFDTIDGLLPTDRKLFYDRLGDLFKAQELPSSVEIQNLISSNETLDSRKVLQRLVNRFSHMIPQNFSKLVGDIKEKGKLNIQKGEEDAEEAVSEAVAGHVESLERLQELIDRPFQKRELTPDVAIQEVVRKPPYKEMYRQLTYEEQILLLRFVEFGIITPEIRRMGDNIIAGFEGGEKKFQVFFHDNILPIVIASRKLLGLEKGETYSEGEDELEQVVAEAKEANKVSPLQLEQLGYKPEVLAQEDKPQPKYSKSGILALDQPEEKVGNSASALERKLLELNSQDARRRKVDDDDDFLRRIIDEARERSYVIYNDIRPKFQNLEEQVKDIKASRGDRFDKLRFYKDFQRQFAEEVKGMWRRTTGDDKYFDDDYPAKGSAESVIASFVALKIILKKFFINVLQQETDTTFEELFDLPKIVTASEPSERKQTEEFEGSESEEEVPIPKKKGRPKKFVTEPTAEELEEREDLRARKEEAKLALTETKARELDDKFRAREATAREGYGKFKDELQSRVESDHEEGSAIIRQIFEEISSALYEYLPALTNIDEGTQAKITAIEDWANKGVDITQELFEIFINLANYYFLIANEVDLENFANPLPKAYKRTTRDKIKGKVRKVKGGEKVPPLTHGLGLKKGRGKDSDSESDEEKGMGMKRIPIKTQEVSAFKPRRIKVGRGIDPIDEPTYKTFGKYVVHIPFLHNNTANFKYKSLGGIPAIKPMPISNEYKDFILDVLATGKMNEKDLRRLDKKEVKHFEKVVLGAGLNGHFKLNKSVDDEEVKDLARFELLRGEYLAGNNAPTLVKELRSHVLKFMDGGRIKRKDGMGLLAELSAV